MNDVLKKIREETGAGILAVKAALEEAGGDKTKAVEILRKKGAAKAGAKADRVAKEGLVESYIHAGGRIGALVEVNCETDFVSRTEDFRSLARDLALHVAAANPLYVSQADVPPEVVEKEKEIYREQAAGKPADVVEKMLDGKLQKFYEEVCLMDQPFVKNGDQRIRDLVGQATATLGENVKVKRFARFVLGN